MGCVYNRGTRGKPNWWVKFKDAEGKTRYERVGEDKAVAEAVLKKLEGDVVSGRHGLRRGPLVYPSFAEAVTPWLERRAALGVDGRPAVRSWKDDRARLEGYLTPFFGSRKLDAIGSGDVKRFIESVRPKLAAQSIRNCLAILSRLFNDWNEDHGDDGLALTNPVARLDRATRRAIGPGWDPKKTPFLRSKADIRAAFLALPAMAPLEPWRAMFAVGVFAGLRTSEIRGLEWREVDFTTRLINIRRTPEGPLKDDEIRFAPLSDTLTRVLKEWRKVCPAGPLCFPSTGHRGKFVKEHSMYRVLKAALEAVGNGEVTWYQATRHTFGSHWVMDGGSLEKLRVVLGHSTTEVTLRYAHLVPGHFTESERKLVSVGLWDGEVLPLRRKSKVKLKGKSSTQSYAGVTLGPDAVDGSVQTIGFSKWSSGRVAEGGGLENR